MSLIKEHKSKLLDTHTHIYIIPSILYFYFQEATMKLIFTCAATLLLITNYCFGDVFDIIQDTNTMRANKYNAPLSPTINPKDPMELSKLSPETNKIDNLLTKNVNTKVHATKEQQKKALQAVFSTEIIYGATRPSYLEGISVTSDIYKHCYILEYSTLLARDCIQSMPIPGIGGISISSNKYNDLCRYSGLDGKTLVDWFFEMYEKHMQGQIVRFSRQQPELARKVGFLKTQPALTTSATPSASEQFQGNWTASYTLKDGSTVTHTPKKIQMGGMSTGTGLSLQCRNYNGLTLNGGLFLVTDSLQTDFVNALIRSGAYEGTREEKSTYDACGNWTDIFTLLDGTQIVHTPTKLVIFPGTQDEQELEDIFADKINDMAFKNKLRLYTKSSRTEFLRTLQKENAI